MGFGPIEFAFAFFFPFFFWYMQAQKEKSEWTECEFAVIARYVQAPPPT